MPVSNDPYCCDFHREQDCLCFSHDKDYCECTGESECDCDYCPGEEDNSYLADLMDEIKMEETRNA